MMILIERLLPPKLFAGHGSRDLGLHKINKNNVYFQAQAWQIKEIESEVSVSGMIDAGGRRGMGFCRVIGEEDHDE